MFTRVFLSSCSFHFILVIEFLINGECISYLCTVCVHFDLRARIFRSLLHLCALVILTTSCDVPYTFL